MRIKERGYYFFFHSLSNLISVLLMNLASVQKKLTGDCLLTWMTFGVMATIRFNMMVISGPAPLQI